MKNKRIIKLLALTLALSAILLGCKKETENPDATEMTTEATTTYAETVDTAYESIPRFDSEVRGRTEFSFMSDPYLLSLGLPAEWVLSAKSGGYIFFRENQEIGRIFSGEAEDTSEWTVVKSEESADSGLLTGTHIERRGSGDGAEYRYRFCYSYAFGSESRLVTMTVKLDEVDSFLEQSLAFAGSVVRVGSDSGIGCLADSSVSNIAILGNSFVGSGSSNIGAITQEMLEKNGKRCTVDAVSRGMANISTYTDDSSMMQKISSGYYDIVFICGLYSTSQVQNLSLLKSACYRGNAKLVIFPAHNESASAITQAKNAYPDLVCLDWKNEIDMLISNKKIDRWEFCVDDYYNHSTPLAGYVGAHMIYRAIYSEVPTVPLASSIQQSYVNSLLGDYVTTGSIPLSYKSGVKYLS